MRKRLFSVLVLLLICALAAQTVLAVEPRTPGGYPTLYFRGKSATCSANYRGSFPTDNIHVTITLYNGSTYVASWNASGTGRADVSGECQVEYGKTYRLEMSYSVNGVRQPTESVTGTCRRQ